MPRRKTPIDVAWQGDAEQTVALLVMVEAVRDGRLRARRANGSGVPFTHEDVVLHPDAFQFHGDDVDALHATIKEAKTSLPNDMEGQFAVLDMLTGMMRGEW